MRTFLFLLCLIGSGPASAQIHFSGFISGIADENLILEYPSDLFGTVRTKELPVIDNRFSYNMDLATSGTIKLSYKDKDRSIFVWKGSDSLHISFDADFLDDSITIDGAAGPIWALIDGINHRFGSRLSVTWLEEQAADATNIDAMEMDAFRLRNDVVHGIGLHEGQLPTGFVSGYRNHLGYYYYLSLFKFSSVKTAHSRIPKATEIPQVLLEGLDWERMNRSSELDSEFFRELLLEYVDHMALSEYDFMKFQDKDAAVQEAFNQARAHLKDAALSYFLTATMLRNAEQVRPSLLRQMHTHLKQQKDAEEFVPLVEERIGERLKAEDDEQPVAVTEEQAENDLLHIEVDGLDGKKFFLSELKGKVIYLDIWASWCGPCRKQFPAAKALKAQLTKKEKKNIVFLYISIDNTETVWKMAIEQLGIKGVHGLSKGGWGSEVTAKFGVRSIPRYLIFDRKGKAVDQNAPRPSDPNLPGILRKLAAQ